MRTIICLTLTSLTLGLTLAQAEPMKYTQEKINKMPRFSSIEQQRCPKARFPSVKNRLECKKEVRVEIYEKRNARDSSETSKSEG